MISKLIDYFVRKEKSKETNINFVNVIKKNIEHIFNYYLEKEDEKILFAFFLGTLYEREHAPDVFGSIVLKGWSKRYMELVNDTKQNKFNFFFRVILPLNKLCRKYKIRRINNDPDHIEIDYCSPSIFSVDDTPYIYIQKKGEV